MAFVQGFGLLLDAWELILSSIMVSLIKVALCYLGSMLRKPFGALLSQHSRHTGGSGFTTGRTHAMLMTA